eukprot:CAMPEP_0117023750 /NCGR_PEP_ID=MMETSP0472-20121206/17697_1 /TAXON_ID=693140 ORGANISM="Tiarina fusus, Strain LIS" /NCGR_SAMPLE_ID=MMETSP0472 /ASSEMBLY_ACC=CAM_ASM_000603 /LENGTH=591 /DNA_ID=CAMNT_0004729965 /DNA_START=220 /DNA_END=1995 /DNA_ORIENTATION=-
MRFSSQAILLLVAFAIFDNTAVAVAKKPSRPSSSSRHSSGRSGPSRSSRRPPVSKKRDDYDDDYDDEDEFGFPDDPFGEEEELVEEYDEEEEEEDYRPKSRRGAPPSRTGPSKRPPPGSGPSRKRTSSGRSRFDEPDVDYDRPRRPTGTKRPTGRGPPPSRRSGAPPSRGRRSVVPYTRQQDSTFTRFTQGLKSSMPDPSAVRAAAVSSLNMARETTSNLSSNLYREVKGLTSSELEQVMLKATRPDDTAVKGKHVERLVGVTYQISSRYDIYDAVLRKLWSKMAEKDWRTTIKSLYILHRFSADGAPEHAPALKARLRELRRTRDPKRKDKYFNSKQLLAGDGRPDSAKFRAFMSRYAHYVLLRAQCFGGMFDEISSLPSTGKDKKKALPKPITSTCLRTEHLDAAALILKAGVACQLKDGEECENTAIAVERVASDLMGLAAAVATALNRALKDDGLKNADASLIKRWCEFYSEELLPQTRTMVKKTSPKLDAYGLFLPSRMGATVSQDALQKGLKLEEIPAEEEVEDQPDETKDEEIEDVEGADEEPADSPIEAAEAPEDKVAGDEAVDEYDEYEYDEEEYYDDEEPF